MNQTDRDGIRQTLSDWHNRVLEHERMHYESASRLTRWHYRLGIPVVVLSAITGASLFVSLEKTLGFGIKLALGITSIIIVMLSGLQTFLRLAERAATHLESASRLGSIRREIEQLQSNPPEREKEYNDRITDIRKQIDDVSSKAPVLDYFMKLLRDKFIFLSLPPIDKNP